jgi:hypothetical protein
MMRPLAVGGNWLQQYLIKQRQKLNDDFWELGGMFTHVASSGPVDDATYDDPHKPPERTELNKDLEGWEPLF